MENFRANVIIININLCKETSHYSYIQYEQCRYTKYALKAIETKLEDKMNHELTSKGFVILSILKCLLSRTTFL